MENSAGEAVRLKHGFPVQSRRLSGRWLKSIAVISIIIAVWFGGSAAFRNAYGGPPPASAIEGTWELQSLNGQPIGENTASTILSQRAAFHEGIIRGETLLRADPEAATTVMPFPDESVRKVIANADGTRMRILWNGAYEVDSSRQMTLRIGKAIYFAKVIESSAGGALTLNQDVILTIQGVARYRRTSAVHSNGSSTTVAWTMQNMSPTRQQ